MAADVWESMAADCTGRPFLALTWANPVDHVKYVAPLGTPWPTQTGADWLIPVGWCKCDGSTQRIVGI